MHFFRRRPYFYFPSSSSSSFRPSPAPAHACQIQHLKFHRVLLPTSGRGGRMLDSPGSPLSSLPPHLLLGPPSPLLSSPRPPVCLAGYVCVRCARTAKISICSLIQSRSSGGATCVHFSPSASVLFLPSSCPVPLSLSFPRRRRLTSISGRGRGLFPLLLCRRRQSHICMYPATALHFVWYFTVANASLLTNVVVA